MAYLTPDEQREEWEAKQYGTQGSSPQTNTGFNADWRPTPSGQNEPGGTSDAPPDYWDKRLDELAGKYGVKPGETDLANLKGKGVGDVSPYLAALEAQYKLRGGSQTTGGLPPAPPRPTGGLPQSPWGATFNDPLTQQYEQLLQAQLGLYQQQMEQMKAAVKAAEARRAATEAAGKNLEGYVNERVTKLKGPAYTGTEQEVLRTQYLDPLERDRTAAQQRALQSISSRGMDPSSGVAQQLLLDVNRAFDEQRTRGQGAIATRQIEEQRSREQEAQQLLQYLTMLPDAMARGDLDFVNYTQGLVSQPGQQGITIGKLLADIPSERLNDALRTLGLGGTGGNSSAQLLQLLANSQQQNQFKQSQNANAWQNIGWGFF